VSVAWDESYQGQLRALAGDDRPLLFIGARCVVVDEDDRVLLIRRADNGEWALPAGAMELGESIGECDETTDAAFYPLDRLPSGLARSVAETVDDFVGFRRTGRFVAK
jgi:8-oxo-dGTP pyrophosphatase MutT (NUDIX family)